MDTGTDVVQRAVSWAADLLTGDMAATIAIIAIAIGGISLWTGRLQIGQAARVLIGCFLVFGAAPIATSLANLPQVRPLQPAKETPLGIAEFPASLPSSNYDPYAGASIPQLP